jgi:hypothetical protein
VWQLERSKFLQYYLFSSHVKYVPSKLETLEKTLLDRIQYLSKEFLSFSDTTKHAVQDHTIQLEKLKDHLEILQETSNQNATSFVTKLDDERAARKDKEESLLKLIDGNKQEVSAIDTESFLVCLIFIFRCLVN